MGIIGSNADPTSWSGATSEFNWSQEAFHGLSAFVYTASAGETITEFAVYGAATSGTLGDRVAVYTVVSNVPTTLVGTINVPMTGTTQWHTASASIALTAGTTYTIARSYWNGAPITIRYSDPGGTQVSISGDEQGDDTFKNPWVQTSTSGSITAFYATVSASGDTLTVANAAHAHSAEAPTTTVDSPNIAASNSEFGTSMGAQAINMPTGVTAGDLLLAFAVNDNPSTTDMSITAGGWTIIHSQVQGANVVKMIVAAKIATGSDSLTITGATQDYCATTHRIVDHAVSNVSTDIAVGSTTGTTGNTDPPNLSPGTARHWLWFAAAGVDFTTGNSVSAVPTGYTSLSLLASASSTSSVGLGVAYKYGNTTSENPGTFTNTSRPWIGITVGVPKDTAIALTVADASHAHAAEALTLSLEYNLAPDNAAHGHIGENAVLGITGQLGIADAAHTHAADTVTLLIPATLVVADGVHGHTAGNVDLVLLDLTVAAATHAHSADNVALTTSGGAYTDDFNRADSTAGGVGLGAAWSSTGSFHIAGNRATKTNGDHRARYLTDLASTDMWAECDMIPSGGGGDFQTVLVRCNATNSDGYEGYLHPFNGVGFIGRFSGGSSTDIADTGTAVPGFVLGAAYRIRLEVQGTALRLYVNGTLRLSTTDTVVTSGGYTAIGGFLPTSDTAFYDNFSTAALTPTATLGPADGLHGHSADNVSLSTSGQLGPSDGLHAVTSTHVDLVQVHTLTVTDAVHAHTAASVAFVRYPVAVSGRKWVDQYGDVYLIKSMSSWSMSQNATNAEITQALEGLRALGFNSVNVAPCGVALNASFEPRYSNIAGQPFFTGSPFASSLGAGWASMDWVVSEASRLGMTIFVSMFVSWLDTGIASALIAAGTANCRTFGQNLAARYSSRPNVVWHVMGDFDWDYGAPISTPLDSLFRGITETETTARLTAAEPNNGRTSYSQFISQFGPGGYQWFLPDANSVYDYTPDSTDNFDAVWNESGATTLPVWDCEPPYINSPHYGANNFRERNYTTFIRGGVGINFGHEKWWPHGDTGIYDGGPGWLDILDDAPMLEAGYAWTLADAYCADPQWTPDSTVLVAGLGTGDTKAAAGRSLNAELVYFPTSRSPVTVDTQLLVGSVPVRLRWYDPTTGAYSLISATEAQSASRTVTYPTISRGDGTTDMVLVVDVVPGNTVLGPADAVHGHTAANVTLDVGQFTLAPADASHGHTATSADLAQTHIVAPQAATHAHLASHVTIEAFGDLLVADAAHAHSAQTPTLGQEHNVTVADTLHAHLADNLTVVEGGISLVVDDGAHAHDAESLVLEQLHNLAVADTLHAHTASNVRLGGTGDVVVLGGGSRTLRALDPRAPEGEPMQLTDGATTAYRVCGDTGDTILAVLGGDENLDDAQGFVAHVRRFDTTVELAVSVHDAEARQVVVQLDPWLPDAVPGTWALEVVGTWGSTEITTPSAHHERMSIVTREGYD